MRPAHPSGSDLSADRAAALGLTPVSRETASRLDAFVALLLTWQETTNLIAPSTIPTVWTRHVADSLQLFAFAPDARTWIDLGSGGGFPAIPIASQFPAGPGRVVEMVEIRAKKAAFLREAVRVTGVSARVHAKSIADFSAGYAGRPDIVTARALAPLDDLFRMAEPFLKRGAKGLFQKGQDIEAELTQAAKYWNIDASVHPSKTSPDGHILLVNHLEPKIAPKAARGSPS